MRMESRSTQRGSSNFTRASKHCTHRFPTMSTHSCVTWHRSMPPTRCKVPLLHDRELNLQGARQLFDHGRLIADPQGEVVCGALHRPSLDKLRCGASVTHP